MTDDEVYQCMDLDIPVQHAPHPYPPNIIGSQAVFYIERDLAGPANTQGHHLFRFAQTYWYRDGIALQIWELAGHYYCSRVGRQESLVYFGDDLARPLHHKLIFTPQSAEDHFEDMVSRNIDRHLFTDEMQWHSYCAMRADELVKVRDRRGRLS
ncbi:hypothetical protein [Agrobacterium sp. MS2]|uniref:hypothetical protein n=1 Tax=Agrobacterium sp. MS2 TaxID=1345498 RepID=UPI000DBFF2CF|nr:hypothetical protein [Agrobacterium sp. MS2]RAL94706.1 hypothetical protein DOU54_26820 [Agrobacterium sp. MS2]